MTERNYPAEFLASIYSSRTCEWCKHPHQKTYRKGLCQNCYNISRTLLRLEKLQSAVPERKGNRRFVLSDLDFELHAYQGMKALAKSEGRKYGQIATRDILGLDLENEFSRLSRRFVRKDLSVAANVFDWSFNPDQKRLIFHLLSLINRKADRRHRKAKAMTIPIETSAEKP